MLVVRGRSDTGRTETQALLADGNADRFLRLGEEFPLHATLGRIWRAAGANDSVPKPSTTEAAWQEEFWALVQEHLVTNDRRLWVLFDDLDKGPERAPVRELAETLAVLLRGIEFQRRFRLVLLGYPHPELSKKVQPILVRNDATEDLDVGHVQAFLDYCLTIARKNFDPTVLPTKAKELHDAAHSRANIEDVPFVEALNIELTEWYAKEAR